MTTIAYKDGVLAADTLITASGVKCGYMPKAYRLDDGRIVSGCGAATYLAKLVKWGTSPTEPAKGLLGRFKKPVKVDPPLPGTDEGEGIVIDGDVILILESSGSFPLSASYYASGSGAEFARGAMAAGKSAEEAVQIAIMHDCYSGGEITVLRP